MSKIQQLAVTPEDRVYIMTTDGKKTEICEVLVPSAKVILKKLFKMEIFQ